MATRNDPRRLLYDHITSIRFDTYEFTLVSAEELDNATAEFAHQHTCYEIYYTLEESLKIKIKNEIIQLGKYELLIIAKNVEHQVLLEPDGKFHYFVLLWDMFPVITHAYRGPEGLREWEDMRQAIEKLDKSRFIHSAIPFNGYEILNGIQNEWDRKQLAWNSSIVFKMYEFTVRALRQAVRIKITDQSLAGTLNLGVAASHFLHAHFTEPITLDDAANHLNFSSRHVNRAYMKIFNTSLIRNLNVIRIEYAKRYLCFTGYSVEKIAEIVGFACSRILYKLFKKYEGITVSEYRNMKRKPGGAKAPPAVDTIIPKIDK
jgi:AraC-like DNA-binding protein